MASDCVLKWLTETTHCLVLPALAAMASPIFFDPERTYPLSASPLHPPLLSVLRDRLRIDSLFDMQHKVHKFILSNAARCQSDDIILCAPTGSGKTLAYALPILHDLSKHLTTPPRLRAVVIVPTRELARQVADVFTVLAGPLNLSVALATGGTTSALDGNDTGATQQLSMCDVLVATPPRLAFHVLHDASFALPHVRFLVLDESDRLLELADSRWLQSVMPLLGKPPANRLRHIFTPTAELRSIRNASVARDELDDDDDIDDDAIDGLSEPLDKWRPATGLLALSVVPTVASMARSAYGSASDERVRKILVSATHHLNPTYMVHLDLRHPVTFQPTPAPSRKSKGVVGDPTSLKYTLPDTLTESVFFVPEMRRKLPALLYILGMTSPLSPSHTDKVGGRDTGVRLIFTNSIDAAHRLTRLLELCLYSLGRTTPVFEMSGNLSDTRRNHVVDFLKKRPDLANSYKSGQGSAPIIVSSDVLSRGMDIFTIDCVINYDAPCDLRTYLHRAGRTARAGRPGAVVTILQKKQARHFRMMAAEAERGTKEINKFPLYSPVILPPEVKQLLALSLSRLRRVIERENLNLLLRDAELPCYALYELQNLRREEGSEVSGSEDGGKYYFDEDVEENGNVNVDNNKIRSDKKRRRASQCMEDGDVDNDDVADGVDESDDDNDLGQDSLSDLLYAQIAKNVMLDIDR